MLEKVKSSTDPEGPSDFQSAAKGMTAAVVSKPKPGHDVQSSANAQGGLGATGLRKGGEGADIFPVTLSSNARDAQERDAQENASTSPAYLSFTGSTGSALLDSFQADLPASTALTLMGNLAIAEDDSPPPTQSFIPRPRPKYPTGARQPLTRQPLTRQPLTRQSLSGPQRSSIPPQVPAAKGPGSSTAVPKEAPQSDSRKAPKSRLLPRLGRHQSPSTSSGALSSRNGSSAAPHNLEKRAAGGSSKQVSAFSGNGMPGGAVPASPSSQSPQKPDFSIPAATPAVSSARKRVSSGGKQALSMASSVGLLDIKDSLLYGGMGVSHPKPLPSESADSWLSHLNISFAQLRFTRDMGGFSMTGCLGSPYQPLRNPYRTVLDIKTFKLGDLVDFVDLPADLAKLKSQSDRIQAKTQGDAQGDTDALNRQIEVLNQKIDFLNRQLAQLTGHKLSGPELLTAPAVAAAVGRTVRPTAVLDPANFAVSIANSNLRTLNPSSESPSLKALLSTHFLNEDWIL